MTLDLQSATFLVHTATSQGTAYLVAPDRLATCHHVVDGVGEGGDVEVVLPDRKLGARVLKLDEKTDCAIVALAEPLRDRRPLPLAARCEPRAQWDGFGFPGLAAGAPVPFFGMVLAPEGVDDKQRPMVTLYSDMLAAGLAAAVHGLSGGPVAVAGAVVGHFSRVLGTPGAAGQPALGIVYAARAANVAALLGAPPEVETVGTGALPRLTAFAPALGPDEYHAFISYRSSDRAFATRLYERLDAVGLRVFLDQRELVPGDQLATRLHQALGRSRCGIVLVSRGWTESPWCREEGDRMVARAVGDAGAFRVVPVRIDDVAMPDIFQSRLWVDFCGESAPSGRKLDQILYAVIGRAPPAEGSTEAKLQATLTDAADAAVGQAAATQSPADLKAQVTFLRDNNMPEAAARFLSAERLIGDSRFDDAVDLLRGVEGLRAQQLRALALSRGGGHDEALAILEPLFERGQVDAETGGILGGIYKRKWQKTGATRSLIKSLETYRVTYAATGDSYPGINLAATAFLHGQADEAERVARAVREDLGARKEATLDHWNLATLGEACLILGDVDGARGWYEKAVARPKARPADLAAMRRQVRLLLGRRGLDSARLDGSLPVPPVVAFSGHMTDAAGRAVRRFPEERVEAIRRKVRAWLRANGGAVHAVCSAARGSDLLFLEAVLQNDGTATVVLPFPPDAFKQTSVGQGWDARFDAVLASDRVDLEPPLIDKVPPQPEREAAFAHCNQAVIDAAERLAGDLDDARLTLLTVWNGVAGDGQGGTAGMVALWADRGYHHDNIEI